MFFNRETEIHNGEIKHSQMIKILNSRTSWFLQSMEDAAPVDPRPKPRPQDGGPKKFKLGLNVSSMYNEA